ncbi:hypothetical protein M1N88_03160 [Dehalococcoidia bacterium]|nr:hypothetical protein [Dehalococcoidia bacterium]
MARIRIRIPTATKPHSRAGKRAMQMKRMTTDTKKTIKKVAAILPTRKLPFSSNILM